MRKLKINIELNIIYEDSSIIVINKNAGILTHADKFNSEYSLVDILKKEEINLSPGENFNRPGVVHRLDKETSGIIVFAKTEEAHISLKDQFLKRKVEKYYHAIVWGVLQPAAGTIDAPISSFLGKKKVSFTENAKEAITLYKTLKTIDSRFSLVECRILTGRTHQIRVHMLSKGCPIIGDKLYSKGRNFSKNIENKKILFIKSFERQALHAFKISFYHPISKKKLKFKATKPEELAKLEEVLFET